MTYRDAEPPPHRAPPAPPPRRRARRSPGEGREQLLRAATGEFVTNGFAGARISRIVAKAGSNPRMIYHYFGSKSGLYIAVIEEALGGLRKRELQIGVDRTDRARRFAAAIRLPRRLFRPQSPSGAAVIGGESRQGEIPAQVDAHS